MTTRERIMAILRYQKYDQFPLIHFGYWTETLEKWRDEGHITKELFAQCQGDNSTGEREVSKTLGFDFCWQPHISVNSGLFPCFEPRIIEEREDGTYLEFDYNGVVVQKKHGDVSIPAEVSHTLVDRESWEKEYVHRLQFSPKRVPDLSYLKDQHPDEPRGLHCGSFYGMIRDIAGIVGLSYIYADDEDLYAEIIDTVANLSYDCTKAVLEQGVTFDYAHFWEDICFKNGPLLSPKTFREKCGPHYARIVDLYRQYGTELFSVDCDGDIDLLIPTWMEAGVKIMFPIEVGTWNGNILDIRKKHGRDVRGVGGMDKRVFTADRTEIDREIERLKPMVADGGFIPCVDHLITPDADWDLVCYYCEQMNKTFN